MPREYIFSIHTFHSLEHSITDAIPKGKIASFIALGSLTGITSDHSRRTPTQPHCCCRRSFHFRCASLRFIWQFVCLINTCGIVPPPSGSKMMQIGGKTRSRSSR